MIAFSKSGLCVVHNHLADRSRKDSIPLALENLNTSLSLQIFDLLTQRRLRDIQPLRSASKVPGFRNSSDVLQISEFDML